MKALLVVLLSFLVWFPNLSSAGEIKVATVDLQRVIDEYHNTATRAVGEREGFNFILNASRIHPESSDVLFAGKVTDLTGAVLVKLNADKR